MSYTVELSPKAEAAIGEIYEYICKHGPGNPEVWKEGLTRKLCHLELFPEGCDLAPESLYSSFEIRQTLYGPFRILFTIRGKTLSVLTVRHSARRFLRREDLEED